MKILPFGVCHLPIRLVLRFTFCFRISTSTLLMSGGRRENVFIDPSLNAIVGGPIIKEHYRDQYTYISIQLPTEGVCNISIQNKPCMYNSTLIMLFPVSVSKHSIS